MLNKLRIIFQLAFINTWPTDRTPDLVVDDFDRRPMRWAGSPKFRDCDHPVSLDMIGLGPHSDRLKADLDAK